MTSYALAILLYLNALAATSYAQDPENDPDYRGNDPEGAVSTSKLQIHVSRSQHIYSVSVIQNDCYRIVFVSGCVSS